MRWSLGFPAAAALLLLCAGVARAGSFGAVEVLSPGASEYRVDVGGGFFRQGRTLHTAPGAFRLTRNEAYGSLQYTGYDWSVQGRFGSASFDEQAEDGSSSRSQGFKPMIGLVAKGLMYSDVASEFGIGATLQATRYLTDMYSNYFIAGLAITAQRQWAGRALVYGGPFVSVASGQRRSLVIDNVTGLAGKDSVRETPLVGLCAGLNLTLPKSMVFEVEAQYTGLTGGDGFKAGATEWGMGASLRLPLWY